MVRKESIIGCSKRVACKALLEGCVLLDVILCSSQGFMPFQQRLGALRVICKSLSVLRTFVDSAYCEDDSVYMETVKATKRCLNRHMGIIVCAERKWSQRLAHNV
jgi:hypothetical protein